MSRSGDKYGNRVYRNLTGKGYRLFPVHPTDGSIGDVTCWPDIASIPEEVEAVVIVVPPPQTEQVVRQIAAAGIGKVWMQPGAESEEAVRFCRGHGITVVFDDCVMVRSRRRDG